MPKSKRAKTIHLTRVQKKEPRGRKNAHVERIHDAADAAQHVFVLRVHNFRNNMMRDVRQAWSDSKFIFGKKAVTQVALGRTRDAEYKDGFAELAGHFDRPGEMCLLMTDRPVAEVEAWCADWFRQDFARAGALAIADVPVPAGPLPKESFSHALEPQLRIWGLNTELRNGVVTVREDSMLCKEGDVLTAAQARLLKLFDVKMAKFAFQPLAVWTDGRVRDYDVDDEGVVGDDDNE